MTSWLCNLYIVIKIALTFKQVYIFIPIIIISFVQVPLDPPPTAIEDYLYGNQRGGAPPPFVTPSPLMGQVCSLWWFTKHFFALDG